MDKDALYGLLSGRVVRTKRSAAEKARKECRKPPLKKGVPAKAAWDTASNRVEGPPLLWLQEEHRPWGSSRQLPICCGGFYRSHLGEWEELRFAWLRGYWCYHSFFLLKQKGVGPSALTLVPLGRKDPCSG